MVCNLCLLDLPPDSFYRGSNGNPHNPCKSCKNKRRFVWRRINPSGDQRYKEGLRALVFSHYSETDPPTCSCCGVSDGRILTIDHKDPATKIKGLSGLELYRRLKLGAFPEGYQVLCFNCNCGKRTRKVCPHRELPVIEKTNEPYYKMKLEVFKAYSPLGMVACQLCGEKNIWFLTLDHMNNAGAQHRRELGLGGNRIFQWAKKNKFPAGFRVLCYNCNCGRPKQENA